MTERLLTSSDDALELALLGSALEEHPARAGLKDTAMALGLSTATATALAAALPASAAPLGAAAASTASLGVVSSAATAAAPPAAVTAVATTAGAASLATLGKAVVGGALVSFALLSGAERLASPPAAAPQAPLRATTTAPSLAAAPGARTAAHGGSKEPIATEPATPPTTAPLPPSGRRHASRSASLPVAAPPLVVGSGQGTFQEEAPRPTQRGADASLAEETRLLEQARAALDRSDTNGASKRLSEYRSRRPSGVLAQEAGLLEVRLLLGTGQRAAATERARALISRYPGSAYAQSLRRLVAEQP